MLRHILLLLLLGGVLLPGCVQHKSLINFHEGEMPMSRPEDILNAMNIKIQPEDLLRITVHSFDPAAAAPFNIEVQGGNMMQMGQQGGGGLELFMGYLVDAEGFVDFPVLGRVAVAGLTLEEAKGKIYTLLEPYLSDASVNMRFLNFKVTVLGEVNLPGTLRLTNKRVTLLEALGIAGDLTSYANRENILIVREKDGQREFARLNLHNNDIFTSPYFYLQQNDVIYIEPLKVRIATVADPAQRIISYTSGFLSLVALVLTFALRN